MLTAEHLADVEAVIAAAQAVNPRAAVAHLPKEHPVRLAIEFLWSLTCSFWF